MAQQNLSAPESAQINMAEPLYGAAAIAVRDQLREPTDLQVAVHVAQQLLDSDNVPALREALRLMLRAVGADTGRTEELISGTQQCGHDDYHDAHEWHTAPHIWCPGHSHADEGSTVEPPALRCPAAHPEDPTSCGGPVVVTVVDRDNAGADGCEHHGARLLASLEGGRVYALPDAPAGSAIRTFKTAGTLRPYTWQEAGR